MLNFNHLVTLRYRLFMFSRKTPFYHEKNYSELKNDTPLQWALIQLKQLSKHYLPMHQLASKEYQFSKNDFASEDTKSIDAKMARIFNLKEKCLQAPVLDSQGCGSTSQQLFNLAVNKNRMNLCDPVIPPEGSIQQLVTNLMDDMSSLSIQKDFKSLLHTTSFFWSPFYINS